MDAMGHRALPWSCLDPSNPSPQPKDTHAYNIKDIVNLINEPYFSQAQNNLVCVIPINQLPKPITKGDQIAIFILKEEYIFGCEKCKIK